MPSSSFSSLCLSLKILLISSAVLLIAFGLKVSVPLLLHFSVNQAPLLWCSFVSWLKPPYLYVIINCIIITIAATSRFHHTATKHEESQLKISADLPTPSIHTPDQHQVHLYGAFDHEDVMTEKVSTADAEMEVKASTTSSSNTGVFEDESVLAVGKSVVQVADEFEISRSTWIPPKRIESPENLPETMITTAGRKTVSPVEKPLVSSRFGHRKPVRASPEGGKALRVSSKQKRHETLENTWKMITEGKGMPLTRHLKKSDTWENHSHQVDCGAVDQSSHAVKKAETFKDRTNYQVSAAAVNNNNGSTTYYSPAGKLRKEPSLSQDDLNRRVEAFIKRFNEEMRMQRQESLNQYKGIISR